MFEKILDDIKEFNTIIIHRHSKPDGDAIGSQVGLKTLICDNFPSKKVYVVGDEAGRYSFMDGSQMDVISDDCYNGALAIILDTSAEALISDDRFKLAARTARIDHHLFVDRIADDEVTDSSFESCAGMIAYFAREAGLKVSPLAAKSIYTGMVTDSGRFRYDATTARTFEMAAFLMQQPIDISGVYSELYAEDFEGLRRRAEFTLKIKFSEHNVAYIYNTAAEVLASGQSAFNISRGMVGVMGDIKGVDIWVNFTEDTQGILCEIRSGKYNINPVAVKYGGGGHRKASGATVADFDTAMSMLKDLDEIAANGQ